MKWIKWMLIMAVLLVISGCVTEVDPETGEKFTRLDPEVSQRVEKVTEAVPVIRQGLDVAAILWPSAAGVLGIIAGAVGAAKKAANKYQPELDESRHRARQYHTATAAVVSAIEEFKRTNSDDWEKLEHKLAQHIGPEAENVIRALRGLPDKS